jgi:hypothetical protein
MEELNNYSPFAVGIETGNGIEDECDSLLTFSEFDQARADDAEHSLVEDPAVLNAMEKAECDVSNFKKSVRTEPDRKSATKKWKVPSYSERMNGVCDMIEAQCVTNLCVSTIITHIADWVLHRNGNPLGPLSVKVKMKEMKDIKFNETFVSCYGEMKGLYMNEMEKERSTTQQKFEDYFEDLIESWVLLDLTINMLRNEDEAGCISVGSLLGFGVNRVRLISVLERLLLHHFQHPRSGGGESWETCQELKGIVTKDETVFLVEHRAIIQARGNGEYKREMSGIDGRLDDNTHRDLLAQLMCVQKLHRDTVKSSKRNHALINPPDVVTTYRNPLTLPPFQSVPAITDDPQSEDDDIHEEIGFIGLLNSFLDPALIARIQSPATLNDMREWDRRFQLMKEAYHREKGPMEC